MWSRLLLVAHITLNTAPNTTKKTAPNIRLHSKQEFTVLGCYLRKYIYCLANIISRLVLLIFPNVKPSAASTTCSPNLSAYPLIVCSSTPTCQDMVLYLLDDSPP